MHIESRKIDDKKIGSWTGKEYRKLQNLNYFPKKQENSKTEANLYGEKARKMRKKMKSRK